MAGNAGKAGKAGISYDLKEQIANDWNLISYFGSGPLYLVKIFSSKMLYENHHFCAVHITKIRNFLRLGWKGWKKVTIFCKI